MLQVDNLSFSYHRSRPVLDEVSLRVERGLIIGLLGPNGSGKTTLIRLMAGLLAPTAGTVLMDGRPVSSLSRREIARRVAVVPQETLTAFDYTALDMVLMGRYPHLGPFALEGADDLARAHDAMAATGTEALAARTFGTLSGGEKQRVVIASALAQATDLLLLDEPTASLDLGYQLEIANLLRRLNRERDTTLVVSTHDLNLAAGLCDRIVLLKRGRVVADGPTPDTLTADRIAEVYGVRADVHYHERAGHLTVVPLARHH